MAEAIRSRHPVATYTDQPIAAYRGNRFIEALPEIVDPEVEVNAMQSLVVVGDEERSAPSYLRAHMLETFTATFLQPLDQHVELSARFSTMLRAGYLSRNPNDPSFLHALGLTLEKLKAVEGTRTLKKYSRSSGRGMAIVGMSGVGKSRAVEAVMERYPQVIFHPELTGPLRTTHQIVWLKLSCPTNGSIKAVCRRFFTVVDQLLGTTYSGLYAGTTTLEQLHDGMCSVAFVHGLGALVIDEIQNLRRATNFNADAMLRFFLILRDDLNVPVVVIGTETAVGVLGGSMQVARRHAGTPLFERMAFDDTFSMFCRGMFEGQYLREPIEATGDVLEVLYDLSQGVTDILLKLFVLAQWRALALGIERLSIELFREVYQDCLGLLHGYVDLIRSGEGYDEAGFDDAIHGTGLDDLRQVASAPPRAPGAHTARELATLGKVRSRPAGAGGVAKARKGRRAPAETDGMVALFRGRKPGVKAYDVLRAGGFVRDLGSEVIAEQARGRQPS